MATKAWTSTCSALRALASLLVITSTMAQDAVPRFAGANSYIDLGKPTALQLPSGEPFTIEAWVCVETLSATAMIYSKNNVRASPYTYMFGLRGTGTKMSAYTGAGGDPVNTWREVVLPAAIDIGGWHHLAFPPLIRTSCSTPGSPTAPPQPWYTARPARYSSRR